MANKCIYIRNTGAVEAQGRRKSVNVKENSEVNPCLSAYSMLVI